MGIDLLPKETTKVFVQRDVRRTPASTATATSGTNSITGADYVVMALNGDLTAERILTAGDAIDITDGGAEGNVTIKVEDSTAGNKGAVIVAAGEGMNVGYVSGTATVSGENATISNKGIAKYQTTDFTITAGDVALKATVAMSFDGDSGTATPAVHNIDILGGTGISTVGASNDITITNDGVTSVAAGAGIDVSSSTGAVTISGEAASVTNAGIIEVATIDQTNTGTSATLAVSPDGLDGWTGGSSLLHTNITAGDGSDHADVASNTTAIALNTTHRGSDGSDHSLLANKTSYYSIPGSAWISTNPDTDTVTYGINKVTSDQNTTQFRVPVNLPHGAVVTNVLCDGNAGATGENWTLRLTPIATAGGGETNMASAAFDSSDSTITSPTIDNQTNTYWLVSSNMQTGDEIHGSVITYTTDYD